MNEVFKFRVKNQDGSLKITFINYRYFLKGKSWFFPFLLHCIIDLLYQQKIANKTIFFSTQIGYASGGFHG